jgi:GTP-binding protein
VIAFDMPGTTRDAIEVPFERNGRAYTLIDTAGLRRKGRVFETIEKFSVIKTLQAVEEANVVVLMVDATQDISDQDAHIAGFIIDAGRAMVVAVNKWDAVDNYRREQIKADIARKLNFLGFARCIMFPRSRARVSRAFSARSTRLMLLRWPRCRRRN